MTVSPPLRTTPQANHEAASSLQPDGSSRHTTKANPKVRNMIPAAMLVIVGATGFGPAGGTIADPLGALVAVTRVGYRMEKRGARGWLPGSGVSCFVQCQR